MRRILHRQNDSGHNHRYQCNGCERAEIPEIIQVFRHREIDIFMVQIGKDRKTIIDPLNHLIIKFLFFHDSLPHPILRILSVTKLCGGTGKLRGAGPLRIRPDVS